MTSPIKSKKLSDRNKLTPVATTPTELTGWAAVLAAINGAVVGATAAPVVTSTTTPVITPSGTVTAANAAPLDMKSVYLIAGGLVALAAVFVWKRK